MHMPARVSVTLGSEILRPLLMSVNLHAFQCIMQWPDCHFYLHISGLDPALRSKNARTILPVSRDFTACSIRWPLQLHSKYFFGENGLYSTFRGQKGALCCLGRFEPQCPGRTEPERVAPIIPRIVDVRYVVRFEQNLQSQRFTTLWGNRSHSQREDSSPSLPSHPVYNPFNHGQYSPSQTYKQIEYLVLS